MATRATFLADFSSFERAVQQSEVTLRKFQSSAGLVEKALNRMADGFSGRKVMEEATLAAKAVENMGGVSKLTAGEQARLNSTVTEALAKFKALGLEAPEHLKKIQKETTVQTSFLDKMKSQLGPLGTAMAGAFAATSVISAGRKILDFADNLTNLSAKTGISTTGLQKLQLAFDPVGVSMDTVGRAAAELANRVVGGDKSAIAALDKLGLSAESLKRMGLDQMLITVGDAVGKLQSKGEQIYASKTLFGKAGVELLGGLDGRLAETTKKFQDMGLIIDEKAVKAADDFGDQLGLMGKQLLGVAANAIGPLMPALSGLANLFGKLASWVGKATGFLVDWVQRGLVSAYSAIARFVAGVADAATHIPLLGKHLGFASTAADMLRKSAGDADQYLAKLFTTTTNVGDAAVGATPDLVGFGNATAGAGEKAKKAAAELQAAHDALTSWARNEQAMFLFNRDAELMRQVSEMGKLETTFDPKFSFVDHRFMAEQLRQLETTIIPGFNFGEKIVERMAPPPSAIAAAFDNVRRVMKDQLGSIIMQALTGGGDVAKSVGGLVGGGFFKSLAGAFDDKSGRFTSGLGKMLQGTLGKTIGGAIGTVIPGLGTVLGSMVGPLLGKVWGGIKDLFGGPSQQELEGRAAAKQFSDAIRTALNETQKLEARMVAAQGQSEEWASRVIGIRDAYLATGRTAEQALQDTHRLWLAEKHGAEAVQRVIEQINEAFEEQRIDTERLNAAIEKYGFTLEELGPAFRNQRLADQAKELIEDWRVLVNSSIDLGLVNDKMATAMNDYLNAALRTGAEVPVAMKPILESLLAQGELHRTLTADEKDALEAAKKRVTEIEGLLQQGQSSEDTEKLNHELNRQRNIVEQLSDRAFKDLADAGVVFSETMTQGFDRVVLKLQELLDRLQAAGVLIGDLPTNVTVDVGLRLREQEIERYLDSLHLPSAFGIGDFFTNLERQRLLADPKAPIPMAGGGAGLVTQPTLFLAGEAGPEEYVFSGAGRRFGRRDDSDLGAISAKLDELVALQRDAGRSVGRAVLDALTQAPRLRTA